MADIDTLSDFSESESELTNGETCDNCKEFITFLCSDCKEESESDDICTSCNELTELTSHTCKCSSILCVACAKTVKDTCMFCSTDLLRRTKIKHSDLRKFLLEKYGIKNLEKEYLLYACNVKVETLQDICKKSLWINNHINRKEFLLADAGTIMYKLCGVE